MELSNSRSSPRGDNLFQYIDQCTSGYIMLSPRAG